MPQAINETTRMTYEEWQQAGYQVQRGEHSLGRRAVDGQHVFALSQVRPRNQQAYGPPGRGGYIAPPPRRPRPAANAADEVRRQAAQHGINQLFQPSPAQQRTAEDYLRQWQADWSFSARPSTALAHPGYFTVHDEIMGVGTLVPAPAQVPRKRKVRDYAPQDDEPTGFGKLVAIERKLKGETP